MRKILLGLMAIVALIGGTALFSAPPRPTAAHRPVSPAPSTARCIAE